jgi:hypothetical protein
MLLFEPFKMHKIFLHRWIAEKRIHQGDESFKRVSLILILFLCLFSINLVKNNLLLSQEPLAIGFKGLYGQIEVGGKFAGVEFHDSKPLPSRISFYYPVANSIDLSKSYQSRSESLPLTITLTSGSQVDSIGMIAYPYIYTPAMARFEQVENECQFTFSYEFCEDLPVLVLRVRVTQLGRKKNVSLQTTLKTSLRTSHSYLLKNKAIVQYFPDSLTGFAQFNDREVESALIFISNVGDSPVDLSTSNLTENSMPTEHPQISFTYRKNMEKGTEMEIVQLIGMCRQSEWEEISEKIFSSWSENTLKNQQRVLDYSIKQSLYEVSDSILQQTVYWSKACIAANIHYINDWFVPMPCPAEYNFFFTHDLLLTGLGVVNFDVNYVKQGFQFLKFLTKSDSILPHAYYWKDNQFVTEYCQSDNWNHLWFIIAASSYLKHSDDIETIGSIFPILSKSLKMMLENKGQDNLMYASRPDWWDTGNIYGARAYITILMAKALKDYVYVSHRLGIREEEFGIYLKLADRLKKQLVSRLWDDEVGYLLNMLDQKTIDRHYYAGSLLAAHYDLLDNEKKHRLLQSARRILLDQKIGIRNVMPADFHEKVQLYHFQGMESGLAYTYLNGGVWPHGNAWFALGLISNNQPDEAKMVISKYLTLGGIRHSPRGQPSFYEYRIVDPTSPRYGEIDKPTFLWAAGWYLHVLYQLAGLRENSFNIHFNPMLPKDFDKTVYDLTLNGALCRIKWSGEGQYFNKIKRDGKLIFSAVISPFDKPKEIEFVRGNPLTPYLAEANCIINKVRYHHAEGKLALEVSGVVGQEIELTVISHRPLRESAIGSLTLPHPNYEQDAQGNFTYKILTKLSAETNHIFLYFT